MPVSIALVHKIDLLAEPCLTNARISSCRFVGFPESWRNGKRIWRVVEVVVAYSLQTH